jgi:hypothetical protein
MLSPLHAALLGPRTERAFYRIAIVVLYVLISALVLDLFYEEWGHEFVVEYTETSGLNGALNKTGNMPFVSRRLTPDLLHAVAWVVRDKLGIRHVPSKMKVSLEAKYPWWSQGPEIELYTLYLLHFACLIATCFIWRALLRRQRDYDPIFTDFAPALGMLVLPVTFTAHGMIYDFPYLVFASLCFLLWIDNRFWLYYVVYALGLVNHDALAIVAVICFAKFSVTRQRGELLKHLVIHGVLTVAITSALKYPYRDQVVQIPSTIEHLIYLITPSSYLGGRLSYAAGVPLPGGINIVVLVLLFLSIALCWREKNREFRLLFLLPFCTTLALFLSAGYIDEIRVFVPAFPGAFLLGMDTLWLLSRPGRASAGPAG